MKVGDQVAGYEIVAKLSSGGMATVFLGRRVGVGGFAKHVAIKVVHSHLAEDPSFVEMFLDEARLSARIEHPNVVHVHDVGESNGAYFMVMEYVAGCTLAQLLGVLGQKRMRLATEVAVSIAMKLAAGLHAAHELTNDQGENLGVVHRDVSPHNVLLAFKGHVKLIDFGVAKAAERSQVTQGALLKGKIRYMAPEQAFGHAIDRRTDVYALGIVLWEMLTSRRLFDGDSDLAILEAVRNPKIRPPSAIVAGIPPQLDAIVMSALSKDPELRPATAEVFRQKLAAAIPAALAIESSHIADLLGVLMKDFIEAEHKKLGTEVSRFSSLIGVPCPSPNADKIVERLAVPLNARPSGPPSHRRTPPLLGVGAQPMPNPRPPPRAAPPPSPSAWISSARPTASAAALLADPGATPDATPSHVRETLPEPRRNSLPSGEYRTPAEPAAPAGALPASPYLEPLSAPPSSRRAPKAAIVAALVAVAAIGGGILAWRPWEPPSAPRATSATAPPPAEAAPAATAAGPAGSAPVAETAPTAPATPDAPQPMSTTTHPTTQPAAEGEPVAVRAPLASGEAAPAATTAAPPPGRRRRGATSGRRGSQIVDGVPLATDVEF
jgi:serine/threonine-protein kinase